MGQFCRLKKNGPQGGKKETTYTHTRIYTQSGLLGSPDTFSRADIVGDEVTRQEKQLLSLNIWLFSERGLGEEVLTM